MQNRLHPEETTGRVPRASGLPRCTPMSHTVFYCTAKLHTFNVPPGVAFTSAPQVSRLVTVLCEERNMKFEPTVCSVPPGGVTKIEYVCDAMSILSRK